MQTTPRTHRAGRRACRRPGPAAGPRRSLMRCPVGAPTRDRAWHMWQQAGSHARKPVRPLCSPPPPAAAAACAAAPVAFRGLATLAGLRTTCTVHMVSHRCGPCCWILLPHAEPLHPCWRAPSLPRRWRRCHTLPLLTAKPPPVAGWPTTFMCATTWGTRASSATVSPQAPLLPQGPGGSGRAMVRAWGRARWRCSARGGLPLGLPGPASGGSLPQSHPLFLDFSSILFVQSFLSLSSALMAR